MIINVHAGHNPSGNVACGAVGILNESTEARRVKDLVIAKLQKLGHTVYDCTCENGRSQSDVLNKIIKKCNSHKVDLDISIHFNAGRNDYVGDGSVGGTEVWMYPSGAPKNTGISILRAISELGFRNRGVKTSSYLAVLRETIAPAILIECCFVDDKDDANLYDAEKMATAIVKGITGEVVKTTAKEVKPTSAKVNKRVRITASALNVRKGAGTTFPVVTVVHKNEVYTIVEESNGWGKLKSGAGYISLNYTEVI